jgi:hypothetical protein
MKPSEWLTREEFERMVRHYAEGARDIEWLVATCLQYEFGDNQ